MAVAHCGEEAYRRRSAETPAAELKASTNTGKPGGKAAGVLLAACRVLSRRTRAGEETSTTKKKKPEDLPAAVSHDAKRLSVSTAPASRRTTWSHQPCLHMAGD